ncbi:MAG: hypothetical protein HOO67_07860 [Candidatus Peribacteraceae bacterium]|nr:hypothetical protein [Candidatus Peribacteraceae bacterium]
MKSKRTSSPSSPADVRTACKILESAEFGWDSEADIIFTLQYGKKCLDLLHTTRERLERDTACSYIYNGKNTGRKEREMTIVYLSANILLQCIAYRTQRDIRYRFTSAIPKLQEWAKSEGRKIFAWTRERPKADPTAFSTIIMPSSSLSIETPAIAEMLDEVI